MSNLLNDEGRAFVLAHEMPNHTEVRRAPGPVRVVPVLVDDISVLVKDRGHCIVARVTHVDGTSTRHTSPIGVQFQHQGLDITKATNPRAAIKAKIARRAEAMGRRTW